MRGSRSASYLTRGTLLMSGYLSLGGSWMLCQYHGRLSWRNRKDWVHCSSRHFHNVQGIISMYCAMKKALNRTSRRVSVSPGSLEPQDGFVFIFMSWTHRYVRSPGVTVLVYEYSCVSVEVHGLATWNSRIGE